MEWFGLSHCRLILINNIVCTPSFGLLEGFRLSNVWIIEGRLYSRWGWMNICHELGVNSDDFAFSEGELKVWMDFWAVIFYVFLSRFQIFLSYLTDWLSICISIFSERIFSASIRPSIPPSVRPSTWNLPGSVYLFLIADCRFSLKAFSSKSTDSTAPNWDFDHLLRSDQKWKLKRSNCWHAHTHTCTAVEIITWMTFSASPVYCHGP